mgnify:CR=1 FL=1|tara:strand:- start:1170 stop:1442 length:273 start_codon:yes stop_codon:yes gene_type:complete
MSLEKIENNVFDYLLNRNVENYEKKYIGALDNMEVIINNIISKKYKIILLEKERLINVDNDWINKKYNLLLKLQLNTDLITDNIINLMEK